MVLTEETQIFLILGILETVTALGFIVHICSFSTAHLSNGTIHSVSQESPSTSPSPSNQKLGLV